jgi:hypothetical protein
MISRISLPKSALIRLNFKMFHNLIVDKGSERSQAAVPARGVHPVGQQNYTAIFFQIHPEGDPAKSQMSNAIRRKITSCARVLPGWTVKAQRPEMIGCALKNLIEDLPGENRSGRTAVKVRDQPSKQSKNSLGRTKQAGMPINAAGKPSIVVMHFTDQQPITQGA